MGLMRFCSFSSWASAAWPFSPRRRSAGVMKICWPLWVSPPKAAVTWMPMPSATGAKRWFPDCHLPAVEECCRRLAQAVMKGCLKQPY